MKFVANTKDKNTELKIFKDNNEFKIGDTQQSYSFHQQENGRYLLRIDTSLYKIDNVEYDDQTVIFSINGEWCKVDVRDEQDLLLDRLGFKRPSEIGEGELNAPMPGKILEVMVSEGDEVELGDPVAILEAMKMENELKAPVSGTVTSISVAKGDSLDKNDLILEIEASG